MQNRLLQFLLAAGMLMFGACTTWQAVEESSSAVPRSGYAISLPKGWMRAALRDDRLLVTRDGLAIQTIEVASLEPSTAFAKTIKQSKKEISSDLLPERLAELTLAELQATQSMGTVSVIDNVPATLAGQPAFRLHVQYKTTKGLRIEELIYGMQDGKRVLHSAYRAPTLHFFARDLGTFEDAVRTLHSRDAAAK